MVSGSIREIAVRIGITALCVGLLPIEPEAILLADALLLLIQRLSQPITVEPASCLFIVLLGKKPKVRLKAAPFWSYIPASPMSL